MEIINIQNAVLPNKVTTFYGYRCSGYLYPALVYGGNAVYDGVLQSSPS